MSGRVSHSILAVAEAHSAIPTPQWKTLTPFWTSTRDSLLVGIMTAIFFIGVGEVVLDQAMV
jgi:hypothetical protein